jgi:hypothetical protein
MLENTQNCQRKTEKGNVLFPHSYRCGPVRGAIIRCNAVKQIRGR